MVSRLVLPRFPSRILPRGVVRAAFVLVWIGLTAAVADAAAAAEGAFVDVPVDSDRWVLDGEEHRVEEHLGRSALFLHNAEAVLEDVDLSEGVVEFDIAMAADRGFSGVMFHRQGPGEAEEFYLRPHQSGQPDATQYQPVFGGEAAWQILYGPQFAAPVVHAVNAWQHVRIVISGGQADVYVDGEEPALFVEELLRREPGGGLGLFSAFAPAHFSGFRYREAPGLPLRGRPIETEPLPEGIVRTWSVSSAIAEEQVAEAVRLPDPDGLTWTSLPAGPRGIANLARTRPQGGNTVLARITLSSDADRVAWLDFGFSDRVRVFVNGAAVYAGNDKYQSRDHRFLGTVGLFDTLPLSLRKGRNDIVFAVSEDFGGFAVTARLRPTEGVAVVPAP